jgi:hypothetical protein
MECWKNLNDKSLFLILTTTSRLQYSIIPFCYMLDFCYELLLYRLNRHGWSYHKRLAWAGGRPAAIIFSTTAAMS